jgi:hypothetical protein
MKTFNLLNIKDDWGRDLIKDENKYIWVLVDGVPHSRSKDGEPAYPIRKDLTNDIIKTLTFECIKKMTLETKDKNLNNEV